MARDAKNRQIDKRVDVVFRDATLSQWLVIRDERVGQADLGDQATAVGIGIGKPSYDFNHATVIEPKACHVLQQRHFGHGSSELVVESAEGKKTG